MQTLELKVPPPVVALLIAAAMWAGSSAASPIDLPAALRLGLSSGMALAGVGVVLAGAVTFRRARTTVNPMKPENTSALVTGGIFRFTRNPMYVGLALVLSGWLVFLSAPWLIAGPVAFVLYINRFQIAPEERVLARMFGADYAAYQGQVRRWL